MDQHIKHGLDVAAASAAFASFLGFLPSIASLLSIIWLLIQIGGWLWKTFFKKENSCD